MKAMVPINIIHNEICCSDKICDPYDPNILESDSEEEQSRSITYTYFDGTATDIDIGDYVSDYFYYPRQYKYYRFYSENRQCVSFNYSGPSTSLRIFYSNFYLDTDYLVSVPYIDDAIDCYLFEKDCEYIIEIAPYSIGSWTSYHFQLMTLTISTLTNHQKYALHQVFDSSSNVGYHYQTEYFDVSETSYSATYCDLNSYSNSTSYLDRLDDDHWFYDPSFYNFDDRRVVSDTGYDEYSAIAYASGTSVFNSQTYGYSYSSTRFTGTFVSETTVITCAHSIFSHRTYYVGTTQYIKDTGLKKTINFQPGINDYSSTNYYGTYKVNELYSSISYVLQFYANNKYSKQCADYDWSICLTTRTSSASRIHSFMGLSGFSYSSSLTSWSHARSAGYPAMQSSPSDYGFYYRTLWASYPLEKNVVINGNRIESTDIVVSGGNSGGPLYLKNVSIQDGQIIKNIFLLGIVSGHGLSSNTYTSYFYRNTALIVNIVSEVI